MKVCLLCKRSRVERLLDFGSQAIANRFLTERSESAATWPLALGQCSACGMIQVMAAAPAEILKPRVDWISYREAEGHLDQLVERICGLPGVGPTAVVAGITCKDDSLIVRMEKAGFTRTWRIEIERDLLADATRAGPETAQQYLTPQTADAIASRRGLADVFFARHILEHAHNPQAFVMAIRRLVKPGGYIVFEVPDCAPALRRTDYTMPWEEHILYFTRELLEYAMRVWDLTTLDVHVYPYSHENSLVAIVRSNATVRADSAPMIDAQSSLNVGKGYAAHFSNYRRKVQDTLSEYRARGEPIALFGAGHLSCAWLNFLNVAEYIEFVADDDAHKRDLFMPGSRLPIRPSSEMVQRGIRLCLLSLSQESEARVFAGRKDFISQGGSFASIFPGRANSFVEPAKNSNSGGYN